VKGCETYRHIREGTGEGTATIHDTKPKKEMFTKEALCEEADQLG
jgi:hypothetical protein